MSLRGRAPWAARGEAAGGERRRRATAAAAAAFLLERPRSRSRRRSPGAAGTSLGAGPLADTPKGGGLRAPDTPPAGL